MSNSKISLLITDDPDDQQAFSEALSEIAPEWILLVVTDHLHASRLLVSRKLIPDRIFVDLTMNEINVESILKNIRGDEKLKKIPVAVYDHSDEKNYSLDGEATLHKEYSYQELKAFLRHQLGIR